jgi:hypothetical protein
LIRQFRNWAPIIPNIAGIFNLPDNGTIHSVVSIPVQVYEMSVEVVGSPVVAVAQTIIPGRSGV